ncbi:unnamed protein product, partial [Amoebophrya sp. A120]|eukprot:GSA120T00004447001.1
MIELREGISSGTCGPRIFSRWRKENMRRRREESEKAATDVKMKTRTSSRSSIPIRPHLEGKRRKMLSIIPSLLSYLLSLQLFPQVAAQTQTMAPTTKTAATTLTFEQQQDLLDPHLRIPLVAKRPDPFVPPAKAVAVIEGNYTLNSVDWLMTMEELKKSVTHGLRKWIATTGTPQVETSIPLPANHLNESEFTLLWEDKACTEKSTPRAVWPPVVTYLDNSLRFDNTGAPIKPSWIPNRFLYPDTTTIPVTLDPALATAAARFTVCVNQHDTSLRWLLDVPTGEDFMDGKLPNPQWVAPGIHITGERTTDNKYVIIDAAKALNPDKPFLDAAGTPNFATNKFEADGTTLKPRARLHVVGRVWISLLQLLHRRFQLSSPLTQYVPEIIPGTLDPLAELTDDLFNVKTPNRHWSMEIAYMMDISPGILTQHQLIPVCQEKKIKMKGCATVKHTVYEYPSHITDYKLNYFILTRRIAWQDGIKSVANGYELQLGEANYTWLEKYDPVTGLLKPVVKETSLWSVTHYPQQDWRYVNDCKTGTSCWFIPIAPSGRFMHSMIWYRTWSHYEAYLNLCAGEPLQSPELCLDDMNVCHYNLTCLGGVDAYFARQDVRGNYFFRTAFFTDNDDGEFEPLLENTHMTCPPSCCKSRRMCMRTHDVTGTEVPFDRTQLLVFGGRTYVHDYTFPKYPDRPSWYHQPGGEEMLNSAYLPGIVQDTDPNKVGVQSELIWHNCKFMDKGAFEDPPSFPQPADPEKGHGRRELRSCLELATDELWRYDTVRHQWQFMKFDTSQSDTSTNMVGTPTARYAHASQLVIYTRASDPDNVRRQYMYMYGGAAMQCRFGLCDDLWRYEIPWASMAYYPQFPARAWQQGNQWFLRSKATKLCPPGEYCGRFRHSMVASFDNQFLFVFGGQGIGRWETTLFRYRVYTDMWEDLDPSGIKSVTRLAIDYNNEINPQILDASLYDPAVDENISPTSVTGQLCEIKQIACGALKKKRLEGGRTPKGRGDSQMVFF